jgi:hypothetical protein
MVTGAVVWSDQPPGGDRGVLIKGASLYAAFYPFDPEEWPTPPAEETSPPPPFPVSDAGAAVESPPTSETNPANEKRSPPAPANEKPSSAQRPTPKDAEAFFQTLKETGASKSRDIDVKAAWDHFGGALPVKALRRARIDASVMGKPGSKKKLER